jgi:hypothetical protein
MKSLSPSKLWVVHDQQQQHHFQEDLNLHQHRCENLKYQRCWCACKDLIAISKDGNVLITVEVRQ